MKAYGPPPPCRASRTSRATSGNTAANAGEASRKLTVGALKNMTALLYGECKKHLKIVPAI